MSLIVAFLFIVIFIILLFIVFTDQIPNHRKSRRLLSLKSYWNGSNRRRVLRHNAVLFVNYVINNTIKHASSDDISKCGIGLLLDAKLEKGTIISLEIKLPNVHESIRIIGQVIWSNNVFESSKHSFKRFYNTGIKFIRFKKTNYSHLLFDYIRTIENDA